MVTISLISEMKNGMNCPPKNVGFRIEKMPELCHSADIVGTVTKKAAAQTGLKPGTHCDRRAVLDAAKLAHCGVRCD